MFFKISSCCMKPTNYYVFSNQSTVKMKEKDFSNDNYLYLIKKRLKTVVSFCNKMSWQFLKMSILMTVHIWKENHYWQYELSKGCVNMTVYIYILMFGSFPSGIPF